MANILTILTWYDRNCIKDRQAVLRCACKLSATDRFKKIDRKDAKIHEDRDMNLQMQEKGKYQLPRVDNLCLLVD